MRAIVYIDGFNLYYRALRNSRFKWLNIAALSDAVMPETCRVMAVNYYVARVSGRLDAQAPARQHAYLCALNTLDRVSITYGRFMLSKKWAGLVKPVRLRPEVTLGEGSAPEVAYVYKTEEKGSDVNLGAHLVRDAALGRFDMAAVLTNDTDLVEPVRIVMQEFQLPVILLTPSAQPSKSLVDVTSGVRHIQPYLGVCQFPDPVTDTNGRDIRKPPLW